MSQNLFKDYKSATEELLTKTKDRVTIAFKRITSSRESIITLYNDFIANQYSQEQITSILNTTIIQNYTKNDLQTSFINHQKLYNLILVEMNKILKFNLINNTDDLSNSWLHTPEFQKIISTFKENGYNLILIEPSNYDLEYFEVNVHPLYTQKNDSLFNLGYTALNDFQYMSQLFSQFNTKQANDISCAYFKKIYEYEQATQHIKYNQYAALWDLHGMITCILLADMEKFTEVLYSVHNQKGNEDLQPDPNVDGTYDQDDTQVNTETSDEANVDVDIKIDLRPDNEQKLLMATESIASRLEQMKLFVKSIFSSHKASTDMYYAAITKRTIPQEVLNSILEKTVIKSIPKKKLETFLRGHVTVVSEFIQDFKKIPAPARIEATGYNTPIMRKYTARVVQLHADVGVIEQESTGLFRSVTKDYKSHKVSGTLNSLGYKSVQDIKEIMNVSDINLRTVQKLQSDMSKIEVNPRIIAGSDGRPTVDADVNVIRSYGYIFLGNLINAIKMDYNEINRVLKAIYKQVLGYEDLQPNTKLLQSLHIEMHDSDIYGMEGVMHKVDYADSALHGIFDTIDNQLHMYTTQLSIMPDNIVNNKLNVVSTTILNKDSFIDDLEKLSTELFTTYKNIKLSLSGDIKANIPEAKYTYDDIIMSMPLLELGIESINIPPSCAEFNNKQELLTFISHISRIRASVNLSQRKYYLQQLLTLQDIPSETKESIYNLFGEYDYYTLLIKDKINESLSMLEQICQED